MEKTLIAAIAQTFDAYKRCIETGNAEWQDKHADRIETLCKEYLPHGSGLDGKQCTLDFEKSKLARLVFVPADFHHMDEHGSYDGWSEHELVVTPSLAFGFDLKITGRDRNDIKNYLAEAFHFAFSQIIKD